MLDLAITFFSSKESKTTLLSIVLVIIFYSLSQVRLLSLSEGEMPSPSLHTMQADIYSEHTKKQIEMLQRQYIDAHNQIKKELRVLQKETAQTFFLKEIKWKKGHFQAVVYMPYRDRGYIHEIWPRYDIKIAKIVHKKNITSLSVEWDLLISNGAI